MIDKPIPSAAPEIRCPCGVELVGSTPSEKRKDILHLLQCHLKRSKKPDLHFISLALAAQSEEAPL